MCHTLRQARFDKAHNFTVPSAELVPTICRSFYHRLIISLDVATDQLLMFSSRTKIYARTVPDHVGQTMNTIQLFYDPEGHLSNQMVELSIPRNQNTVNSRKKLISPLKASNTGQCGPTFATLSPPADTSHLSSGETDTELMPF